MSKVGNILAEELGPEDDDPTPRGGPARHGGGCLVQVPTAVLLALLVIALAVVLAAGLAQGSRPAPRPVPTATLPADPGTPAIRPSCEEPHSGCPQRGDAAEARWSR